jgi:small subunit ribosomal protein S16
LPAQTHKHFFKKTSMPAKLRLQRHGKKGAPYYHIVVADARSPRDGKYIERIGSYNPNTNPATITLDVDGSVEWLSKGAQPTDTVRAILSYKGAMYKNHLRKGVLKGALTEEQAAAKFEAWMKEKDGKIDGKRGDLAKSQAADAKARLAQEVEIKNKRAEAIAAKNAPEVVEAPVVEEAAPEAPAAEETKADSAE